MKNVTVIVTGGARGIGAAVTRELCGQGDRVMIADILEDEGADLAGDVGDAARFHRLDVTDPAQWRSVVEEAVAQWGEVSALVNNAGIVEFGPIAEQTPESFRRSSTSTFTGRGWECERCFPPCGVSAVVASSTSRPPRV